MAASVATALAIALVGGAALAAPPNNDKFRFTNVNADIGLNNGNVSIDGASDQSPATTRFDIGIYFNIDGFGECYLDTGAGDADYIDDDGTGSLDVNWSGTGECGAYLEIQTSWYYDTRRHRSHTNSTGQECKSVSQLDDSANVGVTITADSVTILDGVFQSVGWYQTGKGACHGTGTPGNPNP